MTIVYFFTMRATILYTTALYRSISGILPSNPPPTYSRVSSNFHSQNVAMKPRITPCPPANFAVPENYESVFLFFPGILCL